MNERKEFNGELQLVRNRQKTNSQAWPGGGRRKRLNERSAKDLFWPPKLGIDM